jgi:soluble lytic murein transglycosylase-like protein
MDWKQIVKVGLAAGLLWMLSGAARADIYRYIDASGVMHFTNVPTSSKYRLYISERRASIDTKRLTRYDPVIKEASRRHAVPMPLLKAVIKAESDYNPKAVSKAGAMGLMQIMPQNFKEFNLQHPFDPRENIMAGTRYLKALMEHFPGKLGLALAAYNAGPEVVDRHQAIPPYPETVDYVSRVLQYYHDFK